MGEFFLQYIGVNEEIVESFELLGCTENRYDYLLKLKMSEYRCPHCLKTNLIKKGYTSRNIHYPFSISTVINIKVKQQRIMCKDCGSTFNGEYAFLKKKSKLLNRTIEDVLTYAKSPHLPFSEIARFMGISVDTVIKIFDKHVSCPPIKFGEIICIDETRKSDNKDSYIFVVVDFQKSKIIDILESNEKFYIADYLENILLEEREKVRRICIDLFCDYRDVIEKRFPNAIISVDYFHLLNAVNNLVRTVIQEVLVCCDEGLDEYDFISNNSYLLTMSSIELYKNGTEDMRKKLTELLKYPMLAEAYACKEMFVNINHITSNKNADEHLRNVINSFEKSGLHVFEKYACTLQKWNEEIINSFVFEEGRRVNNGVIEAINKKIKILHMNGNGMQNFERFKKRVLYSLNNKEANI